MHAASEMAAATDATIPTVTMAASKEKRRRSCAVRYGSTASVSTPTWSRGVELAQRQHGPGREGYVHAVCVWLRVCRGAGEVKKGRRP